MSIRVDLQALNAWLDGPHPGLLPQAQERRRRLETERAPLFSEVA